MRFAPNTRVDSACNRWRWFESLSHSEILEVMQEADVLVLPSLAEGCALVVLEALACGLPVIVTPNTGSLEFVRDGYEGFVVPTCNSEAIAERLNRLCRDRDLLASMSQYARQTAIEKSWEVYRNEWAEAVRGAICQ
jgi:glycosyltransferase involved in cell wall biosynthesis